MRARAILKSSATVRVELNGSPVWIETVDENSMTATVHPEGRHQASQVVKLDQLQEK
ncbi:MAG: H-type small acid-soluble spore protein [Bacillota bacterium]